MNASKETIRPSEKRLSEIMNIGNDPLGEFRRNSEKQFTSKLTGPVIDFNRGFTKLTTTKSTPLLGISKAFSVGNSQSSLNTEKSI